MMSPAIAAIESRNVLKSYFETGDVPTEQQFSNLIDSFISRIDDGLTYNGATPDAVAQGSLLGEGAEVGGPGTVFTPVAGLGEEWVGQSGFLGLSLTLNSQTHYGYLQISSPPGDQYPMFVEHVAYETQPNTPIVAAQIPEPSTLAVAALGLIAMCRRRGKRERSSFSGDPTM
jgi:hypothetical protein